MILYPLRSGSFERTPAGLRSGSSRGDWARPQAGALRGACPRLCSGTPAPCIFPAALAPPQPQCPENRPLDCTPGLGQLTPIPSQSNRRAHPRHLQPCQIQPPAHIPRTPDAGAAGSPSGGGLLPRSPSRDVPPALEVASAMARAGQVRGCGRPERRGAAGSSGRCSRGARRRWRQRPRPPAPAAVPACPSAASRLRPRGTSILLLVPAHVALGFSTPPVLFSGFCSRPPTSLSGARLRPHQRCILFLVPARVIFWVSSPPAPGLDYPPPSLSFPISASAGFGI